MLTTPELQHNKRVRVRLWLVTSCAERCVHTTAESAWDLLTFHHTKFVISSCCEGYYIHASSRCLDFNCPLVLISLITTVRRFVFPCQKSEDERQMILVPTNLLVWFPPVSFLSLNGTQNMTSFDCRFQKPWRSSARVASPRVVFRYGLHHVDCMWFSCWVKISGERGREMLDSHYRGYYSTSARGYQCHTHTGQLMSAPSSLFFLFLC